MITLRWDRWTGSSASTALAPPAGPPDITYDAYSRPVLVGPTPIGYDPVSGRLDRIGDQRTINVGAASYDPESRTSTTAGPDRPAGGIPVADFSCSAPGSSTRPPTSSCRPTPCSPSPGATAPPAPTPTPGTTRSTGSTRRGLRPISIEEYDAIRTREEQGRVGQAWEAIKEDPWGTLAAVGVVAAGVGLMFRLSRRPRRRHPHRRGDVRRLRIRHRQVLADRDGHRRRVRRDPRRQHRCAARSRSAPPGAPAKPS